jgi:hypothetical protein
MAWDPTLAAEIWQHVNRGFPFDWKLRPAAKARLPQLVSLDPAILEVTPDELNERLRSVLSPTLKTGDEGSLQLARWIIRDWGAIKSGADETLRQWMAKLGTFEDKKVSEFIDAIGTTRISSWSKLVSFANSDKYAIYDALTSVSLNCALRRLGEIRRFHMPAGQNDLITEGRLRLLRLDREQHLMAQEIGYRDYIELLMAFKAAGLAPSVLRAEMIVYANAAEIVREFLNCGSNDLRGPRSAIFGR